MKIIKIALCTTLCAALIGCVSVPNAPTTAVMPGPGVPFDQFQKDDSSCQQFARQQVGTDPNGAARDQAVRGAIAGTIIGAAAGAILSGGHGPSTRSGAGAGLFMGSAAGAGAANQSAMTSQRRYNIAYEQCMYAKGNQVPGHAPPRYLPPPPPRKRS
jgi:hypothetical protein